MNLRKVVYGVLAGGALAVGGLAVPTAQAVEAPVSSAPSVVADDNWQYVGDFFWQSECHEAGTAGIKWTKYKCVDGSAFPGDDYELWVVYK
ncbi:hypothetical protein [Kribbella sp. DT2]|uniref:hypothetical protein n=1 Tax=Kribbella sp. DT2 TaxID=3393427 RepID=UPI003CEDBEEC